jgi:hypothetical protein
MCIIQKARGEAPTEAAFHGDAVSQPPATIDGFAALDPYFPAHAPLQIDDDAFASFFGGHAYVADP